MEGRGRKLINLVMDRHEPSSIDTMTYLNNVNIVGVADQSGNANRNEQVESIYSDLPSLRNSPYHNEDISSIFNNVAEYDTSKHESETFEFQPVRDLKKSTSTLSSSSSDSEDSTASKSILTQGNVSTLEQDNYVVPLVSEFQLHLPANNNSQPEISELVLPKSIENSANVDSKYLKSDCEDFSPDDSGDEHRPSKRTRKMSSSSLSSSFSSSSSSSSSSRAEKKNDIETCKMAESNSIVAIFDLQAVMPVPIGESSAFFYKSKLNCLNLTITDIKNKETICYFWHEALGGRGAVEIGSCVYKFLQKVSDKYPNSDVTFYTDNCCGQQKNR
ncbi:unnamed protein product [Parnassius apollo]|uniref:(apollo) hypothetical protein n=1 Tax=Parnassius apollo TaxID=110799 RepID=A0A8S3W7C8_PARAO|nr:unnamed protein product [Parnassius apollo]